MSFGVKWPDPAMAGWWHHATFADEDERDLMLGKLNLGARPDAVKCDCGRSGVFYEPEEEA